LYPDDVPEEVKKRRNNDLLAIQGRASLADHRRWIGTPVDVLVEGPSKKALDFEPGGGVTGGFAQLTGRTMTDHIVGFDGPARPGGPWRSAAPRWSWSTWAATSPGRITARPSASPC